MPQMDSSIKTFVLKKQKILVISGTRVLGLIQYRIICATNGLKYKNFCTKKAENISDIWY